MTGLGIGFHALVPAAGSGERFGGGEPKQFRQVAGRAVLAWAIERLLDAGALSVTVAVPAGAIDRARELVDDARVLCAVGGADRQASVEICLAACPADPEEWVAVHDGARPAVMPADVRACVEAAQGADGAVLGRPVADTLKLVAAGEIQSTVDRSFLFRAETPQLFSHELLARALEEAKFAGFVGTDEASVVEQLPGVRLAAVTAGHPNPKLTSPGDLVLIAALLQESIH